MLTTVVPQNPGSGARNVTDLVALDTLRMTGNWRQPLVVQKNVNRSEGCLQSWYCPASCGLLFSETEKVDNPNCREAMYSSTFALDKSYIGKSPCGEV
jgi:hypothetical protein